LGISYKALLYKLKQIGAEMPACIQPERSRAMKSVKLVIIALFGQLFLPCTEQQAGKFYCLKSVDLPTVLADSYIMARLMFLLSPSGRAVLSGNLLVRA